MILFWCLIYIYIYMQVSKVFSGSSSGLFYNFEFFYLRDIIQLIIKVV